ncbi:hypothetical protein [Leeia aquatica]|uniref:Uncharacterized protein n=1 Tax=Leeia aquatica TaxID=2725557 RepID=A0A847S4W2_9NEIS|nr:hypothetical protein [Leeia aquatica]NLR74167.1 hypothetical protein [Leeia aquatica]
MHRVETALKEGGAKLALETYFSCEKHEGSAYVEIATGSPPWVSLAEKMLAYSDACYTEGIQAALGQAMQQSPKTVLPLVGKTPALAADAICLPFISDELPARLQLRAIRKSKQAIQSVVSRRLAAQKARCLHFIQSVEAGISSP